MIARFQIHTEVEKLFAQSQLKLEHVWIYFSFQQRRVLFQKLLSLPGHFWPRVTFVNYTKPADKITTNRHNKSMLAMLQDILYENINDDITHRI